mgnify:FL=1
MNKNSIYILLISMTFIYGVDDCVQFIQQPAINSFSIVIDRSGSI